MIIYLCHGLSIPWLQKLEKTSFFTKLQKKYGILQKKLTPILRISQNCFLLNLVCMIYTRVIPQLLNILTFFSYLASTWPFWSLSMEVADDANAYKYVVDQKHTIWFLLCLNKEFDVVCICIMGSRPFPTTREAFAEVRHEKSRKNLMMPNTGRNSNSFVLFTNSSNSKNKKGQGRPWCQHCKIHGH